MLEKINIVQVLVNRRLTFHLINNNKNLEQKTSQVVLKTKNMILKNNGLLRNILKKHYKNKKVILIESFLWKTFVNGNY